MSIQCLKCGYSITEPICALCVINEIKVWLYEQPVRYNTVEKINNKLDYLLREIDNLDYVILPSQDVWKVSIMKCIKCEKEMHLMCFYCVNNLAGVIMKDNLRNNASIESFKESFNTDLYDYRLNNKIVQ